MASNKATSEYMQDAMNKLVERDKLIKQLQEVLEKIRWQASSFDTGVEGLVQSKQNIKNWAEQALKGGE